MPAYSYRLHFTRDGDDGRPRTYVSDVPVQVGDVLELGLCFWNVVTKITPQETGVRLDLAKSEQTREEAILAARQQGIFVRS